MSPLWPCRPEIDCLLREGQLSGYRALPCSDCQWCTQFQWVTTDAGLIRGCLCGDERRDGRIYREPCIHPERRHVVPKVRRRGPQSNLFEFGVSP